MIELRPEDPLPGTATLCAVPQHDLTASDSVWIATALLHYEGKSDGPFSSSDIFRKVKDLYLTECTDNTIQAHIAKHCVANTNPDPNRVRILYAPSRGLRRLFRQGDAYDRGREGAPTHPQGTSIPKDFLYLREWYEQVWDCSSKTAEEDPLLALFGSGAELWKDEHADEYVANLRAGWTGAS